MDVAALAAAVTRHLGGDATIDDLRRLSGGASRETWAFDVTHDGERLALVLRRDPAPTSAGPLDRSTEADVLRAAHDAGVLAPSVRFVLTADDGLGAGFVMDRVDGETVARRILRDDAYTDARPRLAGQCGVQAATIHAVPLAAPPRRSRPSGPSSSSSSTAPCSTRSVSRTRRSSSGSDISPGTPPPSTSPASCTATSATATSSSDPTVCGPCSTGSSPISATRSRTSAGSA